MPCHCTFPKALILPTLFVLSQCYLFVTRKPNEAETKAFFHFTTVEVGSALFLYNWWTLIPVAIIGALPLWPAWYIAMGALALIGWINALRFTFYYYVSMQYPAIAAAVTAAFAKLPAGLSWFVPVCTTAGGCDWYKDLHVNPMTLLWWDDALWLLLVSVIFVTIEGLRYRVSTTRIVCTIVAMVALGWDTVIPLWLLYLRTLELRFAASGEEKRQLGRFTWLYVVLAMCAVCSWWPALLEWAVTRGTVAGQFDDGLVLPAGARATLLILMTFFTWGAYFCADTKVGSGVTGTVLSYAMKYGILCLLMGHVAGAVSIVLIYREMCPHSTLVPHRLPDTTMPDAKPDAAADRDTDRGADHKKKA